MAAAARLTADSKPHTAGRYLNWSQDRCLTIENNAYKNEQNLVRCNTQHGRRSVGAAQMQGVMISIGKIPVAPGHVPTAEYTV